MRNMRHTFLSLVALLAIATALFTATGATQAKAAADLTGVWQSNEGGTWYITQKGNTFWAYGEEKDNNPSWATVGHAVIIGNSIQGTYSTVPKGQIIQSNKWNMKIVSNNEIELRPGTVLYR